MYKHIVHHVPSVWLILQQQNSRNGQSQTTSQAEELPQTEEDTVSGSQDGDFIPTQPKKKKKVCLF